MATLGHYIEKFAAKRGDSHQGLHVFPVCALSAEFAPPQGLLSLEEALSAGSIVATETGDMSVASLRNRGASNVAALDGETLIGGGQNRMLVGGAALSPGEAIETPSCCVEIHRWDCSPGKKALDEDKKQFTGAASAFGTLKRERLMDSIYSMGADRRMEADQRKVWTRIAEAFSISGAATKTLDLHDLYDYWETHLKLFSSRFTIRQAQVGMIVFLDSRTWFADIFPDPDLLAANYRKLLKGYALDALLRLEKDIAPSPPGSVKLEAAQNVIKLLRPVLPLPLDQTKHRGAHFFETAKLCGSALCRDRGFIHIFACSK